MSTVLKLLKSATKFAAGSPATYNPSRPREILEANIAPSSGGATYRVTVALSGDSRLKVRVRDEQASTATSAASLNFGVSREFFLNGGARLQKDMLYAFVFGVRGSLTYNFLLETSVGVDYFIVEEIIGVTS